MSETNCKDWAIEELNEIRQICKDFKYVRNRHLIEQGTERIDYLANRVLEHLEYLEIKESEESND